MYSCRNKSPEIISLNGSVIVFLISDVELSCVEEVKGGRDRFYNLIQAVSTVRHSAVSFYVNSVSK